MLALFVSLIFLGLASIDPVGIGIMPILLVKKDRYKRVTSFLGGSFISLIIMGLVLSRGLGKIILRFENRSQWFVPTVEYAAAIILLIIAITVFIQLKRGKAVVGPSKGTAKWLNRGTLHLFLLGAALVAVQSVLDVVFVIAMIKIGQYNFSNVVLTTAIAAYAVAALAIQVAVVFAFKMTSRVKREQFVNKVSSLLTTYANEALVAVSLILSIILFVLAV